MRVPPFFVPLRGVGVFNSRGVHPHFFELHWRIQDAVLYAGLEANPKPFYPHIASDAPKAFPSRRFSRFCAAMRRQSSAWSR